MQIAEIRSCQGAHFPPRAGSTASKGPFGSTEAKAPSQTPEMEVLVLLLVLMG